MKNTLQVIKPVDTCEQCQSQFKEMKSFYGMYQVCPGDPGAAGLLQTTLEAYNKHHQEEHPIHPDAVKQEAPEAPEAQPTNLLKEFPGIKVFGIEDQNGKLLVDEGLVFAYKNHILSLKDEVVYHGIFMPGLSTISIEQDCMDIWHDMFDEKREA